MNRIKSLFGLISLVLALMVYPLSTEAQTVTVPPGTDTSVQLVGQIYIETANQIIKTQNIEAASDFTAQITDKYATRIDPDVRINDSDRKYLAECVMYTTTQILRISLEREGLNPDDPDVKPYFNQAIEDMSNQAKNKLAGAKTIMEALSVLETGFE